MSIKQFSNTLTTAQEIDVVTIPKEEDFIVGNTYINIDDDQSSTANGFKTENQSGDELTIRAYTADRNGNYRMIDSAVVPHDTEQGMVPFGEKIVLDRPAKFTAELGTYRDDVFLSGYYERLFGADTVRSLHPHTLKADGVAVYDKNQGEIFWQASLEKNEEVVTDADEARFEVYDHQAVQVGNTQTVTNDSSEGVFSGSFNVSSTAFEPERPGYFIVEVDRNSNTYKRLFHLMVTV